jgi:hypothetical protein
MYEKITLENVGEYRGRNGMGKLIGIEVMQPQPGAGVTIGAINSQGPSNSAWLYFDASEVPRLIEMLQKVEIKA